tara:strand:- start:621 stop:1364 length:744 start_codon:yes stop_codon:yes gene_type:complete
MPIYHNIKTIFVRVPKTAGISMSEKFNTLDAFTKYHFKNYGNKQHKATSISSIHESIKDIKNNITSDCFEDYYKVGFVRNPWDWLVSYYSYYKKSDIRQVGVLIDGNYIFGEAAIEKIGPIVAEKRNIKNLSFRDFLALVEKEAVDYTDGRDLDQINYPYQPQYKYLVNEDDKLITNFVGKYENIENDWKFLCEKLSITKDIQFKALELAHHNKSTHKDYRTYYDDRDVEIVYNIYKKDIELFDYSF